MKIKRTKPKEEVKQTVESLDLRLNLVQEDNAFLLFDSMMKDFRIAELEQANADLMFLIMTGGM